MITRRGVLKLFGVGVLGLIATAAYPFVEALARPRAVSYTHLDVYKRQVQDDALEGLPVRWR